MDNVNGLHINIVSGYSGIVNRKDSGSGLLTAKCRPVNLYLKLKIPVIHNSDGYLT